MGDMYTAIKDREREKAAADKQQRGVYRGLSNEEVHTKICDTIPDTHVHHFDEEHLSEGFHMLLDNDVDPCGQTIKESQDPTKKVGGRKFDGEKADLSILFEGSNLSLYEISSVLEDGARKYDRHNWKKVPNAVERYRAAFLRHMMAYMGGNEFDPESGHRHLAHMVTNLLFIMELTGNGNILSD